MSFDSHPESASPKFKQFIVWLRVVVAVQCLGVNARYLFSAFETESDIYERLYYDRDLPEFLAQAIDNACNLLVLAGGVAVGFVGLLQRRFSSNVLVWLNRLDQASCVWITVWMFLIATGHMMRAAAHAEIAWAEHAVRYAAPLALLLCSKKTLRPIRLINASGAR